MACSYKTSFLKFDLQEAKRTQARSGFDLRKENYTLGRDRVHYRSNSQMSYAEVVHSSVLGEQTVSTAALQATHIRLGDDSAKEQKARALRQSTMKETFIEHPDAETAHMAIEAKEMLQKSSWLERARPHITGDGEWRSESAASYLPKEELLTLARQKKIDKARQEERLVPVTNPLHGWKPPMQTSGKEEEKEKSTNTNTPNGTEALPIADSPLHVAVATEGGVYVDLPAACGVILGYNRAKTVQSTYKEEVVDKSSMEDHRAILQEDVKKDLRASHFNIGYIPDKEPESESKSCYIHHQQHVRVRPTQTRDNLKATNFKFAYW